MGWAVLPALGEMIAKVPLGGVLWMFGGGLLYTAGIIFYRLDHKVKYFHAIWHMFVLGGSIAQFIAVWRFIVHGTP
jgi:hemolysin III